MRDEGNKRISFDPYKPEFNSGLKDEGNKRISFDPHKPEFTAE